MVAGRVSLLICYRTTHSASLLCELYSEHSWPTVWCQYSCITTYKQLRWLVTVLYAHRRSSQRKKLLIYLQVTRNNLVLSGFYFYSAIGCKFLTVDFWSSAFTLKTRWTGLSTFYPVNKKMDSSKKWPWPSLLSLPLSFAFLCIYKAGIWELPE